MYDALNYVLLLVENIGKLLVCAYVYIHFKLKTIKPTENNSDKNIFATTIISMMGAAVLRSAPVT